MSQLQTPDRTADTPQFTERDADAFARLLGPGPTPDSNTPTPPTEPPAEDEDNGGGGDNGTITVTTSIVLPDGTYRSSSAAVPADVTTRQLAFTVVQTGTGALAQLGIPVGGQVVAIPLKPCGDPECTACQKPGSTS